MAEKELLSAGVKGSEFAEAGLSGWRPGVEVVMVAGEMKNDAVGGGLEEEQGFAGGAGGIVDAGEEGAIGLYPVKQLLFVGPGVDFAEGGVGEVARFIGEKADSVERLFELALGLHVVSGPGWGMMRSPEEFESGAGDPPGIVGFGKCGAAGAVTDTGSEVLGIDLPDFGGVREIIEDGQGRAKMLRGMRFFERGEELGADREMR